MAGYGSKILGNAVSSLSAQQALIGNVSSNVANANTPGYVRRVLDLEARSARSSGNFNIGNGVDIGNLRRATSSYLDRLVLEARGDFEANKITREYLDRVEEQFPLDGSGLPIGDSLSSFFSSMSDLQTNPSSIQARKNMLVEAERLVGSIRGTYTALADLQSEADARLNTELKEVNTLLADVARLNGEIKGRESNGEIAAGERDARDQALLSLAEKISFDTVEIPDGSVTLSLKGGFTLVSGTAQKNLELHHGPSFLSGASPPALDGGVLSYIVYDFSGGSGNGHINLTDRLAAGGGSVGGLLRMRGVQQPAETSAFEASGVLPAVAQRIEAMARNLLTEFNREYLGPDRGTTPGFWVPTSGDLDGNSPSPFGFFTVEDAVGLDANANGVPETADLTASGFDNVASRLQLAISDPRALAAARDASGGPPAPADFPPGDSRNIAALARLQDVHYSFSAGAAYSFEGSLHESYYETVGAVGNISNSSRVNLSVSEANLSTAELRKAEIASVSLNEEFSNTIQYQRAFEASSRLVQMTSELFENITQLI